LPRCGGERRRHRVCQPIPARRGFIGLRFHLLGAEGFGRGGNNNLGATVLVDLPSGGEALLLAEALSVPDFVGVMNDMRNREIKTQGKVLDSITEDQQEDYDFDENEFPRRHLRPA
jgi:hypothetical protein